MIRRALLSTLLALSLVLTSTAAVVADTRMAAAGGFCGAAAPDILLDTVGLPQLDGDGQAVAGLDCPICHLSVAGFIPTGPSTTPLRDLGHRIAVTAPPSLSPLDVRLNTQARAPPRIV